MAARRKRRADGRFQARVAMGKGADGKTVFRALYGRTLAELDGRVKEAERERDEGRGRPRAKRGVTFEEWAEKWADAYLQGKAYNTAKTYRSVLRSQVMPALGAMPLKDIKPLHVRLMLSGIVEAGGSSKLAKSVTKAVLAAAEENGLTAGNAAERARGGSAGKYRAWTMTDKQRAALEAAELSQRERAFLYTLMYAGLRRGEALALGVGDVDFSKREITVSKTVIFKPGDGVIQPHPKSDAGNRVIPITGRLMGALTDYLAGDEWAPFGSGLLFHRREAFAHLREPVMPLGEFRGFWDGIKLKLGFYAWPHMFRHEFITGLYYAGVGLKEAARLAGHADETMTLRVYTHLKEGAGEADRGKMEAYFGAARRNDSQRVVNETGNGAVAGLEGSDI